MACGPSTCCWHTLVPQISAGGKTTSLGDHDSEEEAAKAFDRAAINKSGRHAKTNFPISQYDDEMDQLTCTPGGPTIPAARGH